MVVVYSYYKIDKSNNIKGSAEKITTNSPTFPKGAADFERLKRANPKTGKVPAGARWKAYKQLLEQRKITFQKTKKTSTANDPWQPFDDFLSTLSISRITYDPNNTQIFYFCTGEGWYNADASRGAGVWKSIDGGATWSQLSSTDSSTFYQCQDMKVHPVTSDVYVATRDIGLQRSKNGGQTWEKVLGKGKGANSNKAADIEFTKNGNLFVAMGFGYTDDFADRDPDGIYYSDNGDEGTWTKQTGGFPTDDILRIEIATAPSDDNVVYAIPCNPTTDKINGFYKTINKGITWFETTNPGNDLNMAKRQGWYDLTLAVDPNDADIVVAGGLNLWKSLDGASTWIKLTHGSYKDSGGFQYVHVDQHHIEFINSDTLLFGNDGGVWKCDNFQDSIPVFYDRNFSYDVTQFYAAAIHPEAGNPTIIGGTQDNGSHMSTGDEITSFQKLTGADGSFCAINHVNGDIMYTTTQFRRMYRFVNGGYGKYDTITNPFITNSNVLFINPIEMDPIDPEIIYQATDRGVWRLKNASTADTSDWMKASRTWGTISAIGIATSKPNLLYFGRSTGGTVYRVEGVDTTDASYRPIDCDLSDMLPTGNYTASIYVNPEDHNHVIVTYSNYEVESIFESKNATADSAKWVNIEGDLPDLPVNWALLHPKNSEVCYIGTDLGVFYTTKIDSANTIWQTSNQGLANLRVEMLKMRKSDYTVVAATHGRGLYTGQIDSTGSNYEITWQERGPKNVGGRTRTVIQDPNDPSGQTYWAGSVSGGLWKTENINYKEEDYEEQPEDSIPDVQAFSLNLKSANPFKDKLDIEYEILETETISIRAYNLQGQIVANIIDAETKEKGIYSLTWNAPTDLRVGLYFLEFKYGDKENSVIKIVKARW